MLGLGAEPVKVASFTFGIDTQLFKFNPRAGLTEPLRLICTRWMEPVYDHPTILRAMALLKQRGVNFSLTVVGDGFVSKSLKDLAAALKVSDRVTFRGELHNRALPACLQEHDVYLSASTRDGTSLCLLEAMAMGVFPIVSDIQANREWLRPAENGLLHTVSDPVSLADCIGTFLAQPAMREPALRKNRELVIRKGDRLTNMRHLEEIYYQLRANHFPAQRRHTVARNVVPSGQG